ncbi:hypothetical protein RN001_001846 [Aquatica leii]|uniref:DnaJ homolog subfamily C member 2 n=1 Tax=Aquatica leii TaxID=1421715 RepID=A0AAN7QAP5_9COLE|nr:hypothetical protein RN001_001846 [Aquatica leii]
MGINIAPDNLCNAVAVRYRFVYNVIDNVPQLLFLPHEVLECEVERKDEVDSSEEQNNDVIYEDNVEYLRSLDPKEWKKQDHYRVLGIKNLRFDASDDVVKTAYRRMVLKHHPDKRKALGEEIRPDDDYFTCITMAYETLGTLMRRRAYDSVDPEFDDTLPAGSELKEDFFKVFQYYFDLNSRWSEKQPVPKLGRLDSTREQVDKFYLFWYDFKSWREYSYEDEEDKEKCQDRDERRMCEKINRAERQRKKKEEMLRIRSLVDLAYNADPRIAKFKQEDKDRKLAAKKAKQTAAQAKKEEEDRVMREIELAKEKAEAAERAKLERKRQERELQKKAFKKERKTFRDVCKANNYYANNEDERLVHMQAVDKICEMLTLMELEELNEKLENNGHSVFVKIKSQCEEREESERKACLETMAQKTNDAVKNIKNGLKMKVEWSQENLQLLIKAVNLFPAGTNQRWEVVANFMNQHGIFRENSVKYCAKDVLAKAKDLQNTDFSKSDLKEAANKQAFTNFEKDKRTIQVVNESEISKKVVENGNKEQVWTATEQQLLEQALKTYPASTADRWDRIAECIPNRTKKECMKRYKDLVEIIKAKKAAQASVNSG